MNDRQPRSLHRLCRAANPIACRLAVNGEHLRVGCHGRIYQLLRGFVHGVFALAAFDVLPCCPLRGIGAHLHFPRVNDGELGASRLYTVFVAHVRYQTATILQLNQ
jgi:hypothetical protein